MPWRVRSRPLWFTSSWGATETPSPVVCQTASSFFSAWSEVPITRTLPALCASRVSSTTSMPALTWLLLRYLHILGATVILYDGSPGYPDLSRLWRLAAEEREHRDLELPPRAH